MAKKTTTTPPAAHVIQLDEIAGFTTEQAADAFGERYAAKSRMFLENGKLVFHLENRVKLKPNETIYGILQKRGVPESSVNNAKLVANFITNFVIPGHVTEARFDEVATFRIMNESNRILTGKTAAKMTAENLAAVINGGKKAAIGDELDCLAEHGLTIAGRKESEEKRLAEVKRLADVAAAAAALAETETETAKANAKAQATAAGKLEADRLAAAGSTPAPAAAAETEPETLVVDGTVTETLVPANSSEAGPAAIAPAPVTTPAKPAPDVTPPAAKPAVNGKPSSHENRPASTAEVLAKLAEIELQSYDLDADGLTAVRAKLADWMSLIDNTAKAAIAA